MIILKHLSLAAACGLLSFTALAQSTKPGLWEVSSKMQAGGNSEMAKQMAEAQKQMANMPPAQRKMMEDMMAKQGMNMSMQSDGSTLIKICITPEMASRPPVQQQKDCTYNFPARSGNTQRFSFQCTQPPGSGEGEVTYKNDNEYNGKMNINAERNGKRETMSFLTSGRFLGAQCGAVKPLPMVK
jgi:hypothetical protein